MSQNESLQTALEAVGSNPKVSTAVAAATSIMGTASLLSYIQTALGLFSLAIGCIVGVYVLRINIIKHRIALRMERDGESLKD